jgi:bifunctional UDP-N-acetylglucosamine pyrophosphorylase/glucosamine-1-phosphate N-acetyltransferase
MKRYAIVLAAGKGTRMKTELPKCAYPLIKKPMIAYIVENLKLSNQIDDIFVVVGHKKDVIKDILNSSVRYVEQTEQLGTGHAVKMVEPAIPDKNSHVIILPGDMPLVDSDLIERAFKEHQTRRHDITVVTTRLNDPFGYGRIIRDESGYLTEIVEEHEATPAQKLVDEINTGIYIVDTNILYSTLSKVTNQNQKHEYYLTDIVKIAKSENYLVGTYTIKESYKTMGINDLYALSIAENILQTQINKMHMKNGVAMVNPESIIIGHNVIIEENVTIHPNSYITGNTIIKKGAQIGPNTEIHESYIGERVVCKHSLVYNSKVHEDTTVGPFARLRDGAEIGPKNRVGNFVEIKKSSTGRNTKMSHLAYIGDTTCGSNVNFGCGSVTVNYDGKNKYQTTIGDDVFIGCNVNLIAPIKVEDNSTIAAGSTLTTNVPKGALAIARAYQVNKENYIKKPKDEDKK